MVRVGYSVLVFGLLCACCGGGSEYGTFDGKVKAVWLDDGRSMQLLAPFTYTDPGGAVWKAPVGAVVDGASIPKAAWSAVGGPFAGKYRNASVIHDVACDEKAAPWEDVHEAFFWAMRASGVKEVRAKIMYGAVYHFGPRWPQELPVSDLSEEELQLTERRVLAVAPPGSTTEILNERGIVLHEREIAKHYREPTTTRISTLRVSPPPRQLENKDFRDLERRIEEQENADAGGMTLEEIRTYRSR